MIMALWGNCDFFFLHLKFTSPCTIRERVCQEKKTHRLLNRNSVKLNSVVLYNLTLCIKRICFSETMKKGFLVYICIYNSNKLYILYRILWIIFQFYRLYKNNTLQATHSFIHFQTQLAVKHVKSVSGNASLVVVQRLRRRDLCCRLWRELLFSILPSHHCFPAVASLVAPSWSPRGTWVVQPPYEDCVFLSGRGNHQ